MMKRNKCIVQYIVIEVENESSVVYFDDVAVFINN